jgi:hypothetical protein
MDNLIGTFDTTVIDELYYEIVIDPGHEIPDNHIYMVKTSELLDAYEETYPFDGETSIWQIDYPENQKVSVKFYLEIEEKDLTNVIVLQWAKHIHAFIDYMGGTLKKHKRPLGTLDFSTDCENNRISCIVPDATMTANVNFSNYTSDNYLNVNFSCGDKVRFTLDYAVLDEGTENERIVFEALDVERIDK